MSAALPGCGIPGCGVGHTHGPKTPGATDSTEPSRCTCADYDYSPNHARWCREYEPRHKRVLSVVNAEPYPKGFVPRHRLPVPHDIRL